MKNSAIEQLRISDFDYILSDEKIAKYPLEKRDGSKLLFIMMATFLPLFFVVA